MARRCSTICLPSGKDDYANPGADPGQFRAWLDQCFGSWPELFPKAFQDGYRLKDGRTATRAGVRLRRSRLKATGEAFSIRPSFLLPYAVNPTDAVQGPLFLRAFGGPFWALARVFGKNAMYWYRREVSLGRHSIVGPTVRRTAVPAHLLADEHHQTRAGDKNYIATTVGEGCGLGAALAPTANADDWTAAYQVFPQEAQEVQPDDQPKTVRVDGGASTPHAWLALFPLGVRWRCFLHGWRNLRSRGKRSTAFADLSRRVWEAYRAPNRRTFAQRLRRVAEWARGPSRSAWLMEQVEKLCGRSQGYGVAYAHPGGHRTRNRLDRVMRSMRRYFEDGQHLHGSPAACGLHVRAWALVQTFRPWGPEAVRANAAWRSPAERLTAPRYHADGLQTLQGSASLGGFRR